MSNNETEQQIYQSSYESVMLSIDRQTDFDVHEIQIMQFVTFEIGMFYNRKLYK